MLAKKTSKDQITLPKEILRAFPEHGIGFRIGWCDRQAPQAFR